MRHLEVAAHLVGLAEIDRQRLVRAGGADMRGADNPDVRLADALLGHLVARLGDDGRERRLGCLGLGDRFGELELADAADVGQPHAEGREHAGIGVDIDALHPQHVGDLAGVLAAGAAEAVHGVLGDVIAALDADLLDRVGHVLDRDAQEALGQILGAHLRVAGLLGDAGGHILELRPGGVDVQRLVALGAEDRRKLVGLDLAQHHVAVGHRQRAAAAIAGRAGVGAGAFGADLHPALRVGQDRAAACRDGMDAHHRRAHPHARDLGLEGPLIGACVVADIGRGPAHVEADQLVEAGGLGGAHHADDAAGGAREDRVLALEQRSVGQAAIRLHEHQRLAAAPRRAQRVADLLDIAAQDRRQVGVDHRGVAARDQLDQRADLVAERDLSEARLARHLADLLLVVLVAVAVHQRHGDRAIAFGMSLRQRLAHRLDVHRRNDVAVRVQPFLDLDHVFIEQLGQNDVQVEQLRPVLVADPQQVAHALGDEQHRPVALALQQRVGGDGRAHLDRVDGTLGDRVALIQAQYLADALHGSVLVALGVLREQLVGHQRAIRLAGDDIGEGAAAVDPELPHETNLLCLPAPCPA